MLVKMMRWVYVSGVHSSSFVDKTCEPWIEVELAIEEYVIDAVILRCSTRRSCDFPAHLFLLPSRGTDRGFPNTTLSWRTRVMLPDSNVLFLSGS